MTRYFLVLLAGVLSAGALRAESLESRFLAGLRERHLYRLAEEFGRQRWQRSDLSDPARAELAADLALTFTDHALAAPPERRADLWATADGICTEFAERWPENPRRSLVAVQRALVSLARGQQLRDESAGTATSEVAASQALEYLRAAVRQLNDAATSIERQLVDARLRPDADRADAWNVVELESLSANITFQLARAQRQLGLCYPPQSADRDDALLQAVNRLIPLADQSEANDLVWNARVELAACQRELGRLQPAIEMINKWAAQNPPHKIVAHLTAERVRLLLAAGRIQQAIDTATGAATDDNRTHGELALARLEATLAGLQSLREAGQAVDTRETIAQLDAIRSYCGPYWARRAQLLVGGMLAESGQHGDDSQTLLLAAQHQYFNGQYDSALASYDRAIALLTGQQASDEAFSAGMTAAAIEMQAGRPAQAAKRYRELAVGQPAHPRHAEAHRLAILCLADMLRGTADSVQSPIATSYEQLLEEHVARWPQARSSDEIRLWQGQWLMGRRDWPAAIATLRKIDLSSPHARDAVKSLASCYEAQLAALEKQSSADSRRQRDDTLAAATQQLQPVITGPHNQWPAAWSDLQRATAVSLARLHLQHADHTAEYAERLLAAALRGKSDTPDVAGSTAWEATAQSLLVAALARNGKAEEAQAMVVQLSAGPLAQLLELVAELDSLATGITPSAEVDRRALGRLMLEIVRQIDHRRNELEPAQLLQLDAYRASALSAAGDRTLAIAQYTQLAAQAPSNGDIQERFAAILSASEFAADRQRALAQWQRVEQRSQRGGPRWQRARTARLELLRRMGQEAEADKLLRLTRLLYPDWGQ